MGVPDNRQRYPHPQNGFELSAEFIRSKAWLQCTHTETRVYTYLADMCGDKPFEPWPSIPTICENAGLTERSCRNTLASLERKGFIKRIERYKAGTNIQTSNGYRLLHPFPTGIVVKRKPRGGLNLAATKNTSRKPTGGLNKPPAKTSPQGGAKKCKNGGLNLAAKETIFKKQREETTLGACGAVEPKSQQIKPEINDLLSLWPRKNGDESDHAPREWEKLSAGVCRQIINVTQELSRHYEWPKYRGKVSHFLRDVRGDGLSPTCSKRFSWWTPEAPQQQSECDDSYHKSDRRLEALIAAGKSDDEGGAE